MELVPIIYSSLFFVFSLLGIVLIFSFTYSKFRTDESSNDRISKNIGFEKHKIKLDKTSTSSNRKEVLVRNERVADRKVRKTVVKRKVKSVPKVERKLIEKNKIRVVSNASNSRLKTRSERMRSGYVNSGSRYSVISNLVRDGEKGVDNELYAKFSKMSVEYSQTA